MLVALRNEPRDYAWGSTTLLAALQGREAADRPEAEIWFGEHPASPARVADDDLTLPEWRARRSPTPPAPLPFLVKLLAADAPLSIQVHPSAEQARAGHAREHARGIPLDAAERSYRDPHHKPEVIVAVSDTFEALAGLRHPDRSRAMLATLGPGGAAVAERLEGPDAAAALRRTLGWLLSGEAAAEVAAVEAALDDAPAPEFAADLAPIRRIARRHPADPGVVVALLMNRVVLRRGQALFLPAGALHAYLSGLGVEVMGPSDNVVRGGLTRKHVDAAELLRIADTAPGDPPLLVPQPAGDGLSVLRPPVPDFEVWQRPAGTGASTVPLHGPAVVVALGPVTASTASGQILTMAAGTAAFATDEEASLRLSGPGAAVVAQPAG